ncbi:trypsin-like peptidase domain-containing protein, partial [bacterium]|nr:trypsin-like peptidase domain-containing protein [bacterium]
MALAITVHFDLNKKTEAVTINQTADDPAPEPKVLAEVEPASWLDSRPSSFADLFKEVRSAVVNISTTKIVQGASPFPSLRFGPRGNDPFEDFFDKFFEGVPRDQKRKSLGSGFIIDKEGHVLTNNHVVEGANEIEVHLADERKFKAKIIGTDPETDVAVIKIEGKDIPYVKLGDSDESKVGDWVIAVGNPFGLEHTLTAGIVSAKGRILGGLNKYGQFIQTDASINPGNSGGPLFNMNGEVVGINTAIIAGGQGLGFAIPINTAKILVPQLIKDGKVTNRGWLGVGIQMITDDLAKSFGMTEAQGVLISEVVEKSPADKS